MNTDKESPIYPEESHEVLGCAMTVHNELGYGLLEKPYENALVIEFRERNISIEQQRNFDLYYKDHVVGKFLPDLIVYEKIIIDTKVIDRIGNHEIGQMINYLKITKLKLGYILNFKHKKLEWKRVVL